MQTRDTTGQAFRNGTPVADVIVTERAEVSMTRMPLAGSTRVGLKPKQIRGETTIVFEAIHVEQFAQDLERLASAWDDVDLKRKMRANGEMVVSFDLSLDDDRQIQAAAVSWPDLGLGAVETLTFRLLGAL